MKPSPIQVAEFLYSIYQSAEEIYNKDPTQAVFVLEDVVKLLKKCGISEPDFNGYSFMLLANTDKDTYKALMRKVAKKIEAVMKSKNITFEQLSQMTGKSLGTCHTWVTGTNMELKTLFLIEKCLGITLVDLT